MQGWIKVHRGMSDHFLWNSEPFSKGQAWLDLLLHANFTDNEILIKGQVVKLKRGQQARSEVTLTKQWKWSRNKVRRFLELLKKEGMIESETTHLTSVITICNYNSFQSGDTAGGTAHDTSVDTAGGQVTEHSKECKEREEGKEEKPESPKADQIPYSRVAELYNEVCTNLPKILKPENLNDKRKRAIKKFWNHQEPENRNSPFFAEYFRLANQDQFFCGYNNNSDHSNWRADIEFLMRVETYDKFMERQECLN